MAKTKFRYAKGWGVFRENGDLAHAETSEKDIRAFATATTRKGAERWMLPKQTVRPVTISWEVEE